MRDRVICGAMFHTPARGRLEAMERAAIAVDAQGRIAEVARQGESGFDALVGEARACARLVEPGEGRFLMPGLVDLHIHAPQWPQLGKALDEPLEVWLHKYTFPLEARYADVGFARRVYRDLVTSLLAHGTTTAVYFATIHMEASLALAEICLGEGQRAFVGKVAMDDPDQCPDYYRDADAAAAVDEMRAFIAKVRALAGEDGLVRPIITPRFIPSCTDALLEGLGALAAETGCLVQTHCSESDWERDFVAGRLGRTDAEALRDFGLLRAHTVLAHSNFVTDADLALIRQQGAAVAHCPLSNFYFANAVFPLRRALDMGVRTGLGTDISGGHSPSVLDGCRHALSAARALQGLEHRPDIGEGRRLKLALHQPRAQERVPAEAGRGECMVERLAGDLPEIDAPAGDGREPSILEALGLPEPRERTRLLAERVLSAQHRADAVEHRAVAREHHGAYGGESVAHRPITSTGWAEPAPARA